jgi:hypothetical protein
MDKSTKKKTYRIDLDLDYSVNYLPSSNLLFCDYEVIMMKPMF